MQATDLTQSGIGQATEARLRVVSGSGEVGSHYGGGGVRLPQCLLRVEQSGVDTENVCLANRDRERQSWEQRSDLTGAHWRQSSLIFQVQV